MYNFVLLLKYVSTLNLYIVLLLRVQFFYAWDILCQIECGEYLGIFNRILSILENIVMDLNIVTECQIYLHILGLKKIINYQINKVLF